MTQVRSRLGRDLELSFGPHVAKTILGVGMALAIEGGAFMHVEDTMTRTMIREFYSLNGDFSSGSLSEFTHQIVSELDHGHFHLAGGQLLLRALRTACPLGCDDLGIRVIPAEIYRFCDFTPVHHPGSGPVGVEFASILTDIQLQVVFQSLSRQAYYPESNMWVIVYKALFYISS